MRICDLGRSSSALFHGLYWAYSDKFGDAWTRRYSFWFVHINQRHSWSNWISQIQRFKDCLYFHWFFRIGFSFSPQVTYFARSQSIEINNAVTLDKIMVLASSKFVFFLVFLTNCLTVRCWLIWFPYHWFQMLPWLYWQFEFVRDCRPLHISFASLFVELAVRIMMDMRGMFYLCTFRNPQICAAFEALALIFQQFTMVILSVHDRDSVSVDATILSSQIGWLPYEPSGFSRIDIAYNLMRFTQSVIYPFNDSFFRRPKCFLAQKIPFKWFQKFHFQSEKMKFNFPFSQSNFLSNFSRGSFPEVSPLHLHLSWWTSIIVVGSVSLLVHPLELRPLFPRFGVLKG